MSKLSDNSNVFSASVCYSEHGAAWSVVCLCLWWADLRILLKNKNQSHQQEGNRLTKSKYFYHWKWEGRWTAEERVKTNKRKRQLMNRSPHKPIKANTSSCRKPYTSKETWTGNAHVREDSQTTTGSPVIRARVSKDIIYLMASHTHTSTAGNISRPPIVQKYENIDEKVILHMRWHVWKMEKSSLPLVKWGGLLLWFQSAGQF